MAMHAIKVLVLVCGFILLFTSAFISITCVEPKCTPVKTQNVWKTCILVQTKCMSSVCTK